MKLIPRSYFFDDMLNDFSKVSTNTMKCDVYEENEEYNIEVDIPGYQKEDISIEAENGYITIIAEKAEKNEKSQDKNKKYIFQERKYGKVERTFYLGESRIDNITAKFTNGVLKIKIPKIEEKENRTIIEIE